MKDRRTARFGLVALFGGALLVLLWLRSAAVDPQVHNRYAQDLQAARSLDARVAHDVLRLRFGLIGHYDGLVKDVAQLERLGDRLAKPPRFLDAEDARSLTAALDSYRPEAEAKARLIERFKTTNAALRGSLQYFPVVGRQLVDRTASERREPVEQLLGAVLRYEVSGDPDDRAQALDVADAFERLVLSEPGGGELDPALAETMLLHARNLLERRHRLDDLIEAIAAAPTSRALDQLRGAYDAGYAQAYRRAEQGRWMLFLVGALGLAGILHVLRALAGAKALLEENNEQLERRVGERTAELSQATLRLEHDAQTLTQLNQALEESNRELDDFAYIASHDLKEPLRGINNYAAFLLEDYSEQIDEDGQKKLTTLVRLAGRMDELIDELLHFSRVGRAELTCVETCIEEVVEEVVDSLHISLDERGIEVRVPAPLPTIHCDRVGVTEVFRNLIGNALKYNDKDEKWIEVGALQNVGQSSDGKPHYTFYVQDNGIGIREKHLDSVFRLFRRLHGREKFGGGTGAGLTIVKKIVERHGGRIWLESEFGEGTTFFVDFGGQEVG